jgi:hypothetical protein
MEKAFSLGDLYASADRIMHHHLHVDPKQSYRRISCHCSMASGSQGSWISSHGAATRPCPVLMLQAYVRYKYTLHTNLHACKMLYTSIPDMLHWKCGVVFHVTVATSL